jgi:hypothetical protein
MRTPKIFNALRKHPPVNLALLDATNEEPGKILGTIVNLHRTRSAAIIDKMDFAEGTTPRPKTRIVTLKGHLPVGALVTPNDVQPMSQQEVNRLSWSGILLIYFLIRIR